MTDTENPAEQSQAPRPEEAVLLAAAAGDAEKVKALILAQDWKNSSVQPVGRRVPRHLRLLALAVADAFDQADALRVLREWAGNDGGLYHPLDTYVVAADFNHSLDCMGVLLRRAELRAKLDLPDMFAEAMQRRHVDTAVRIAEYIPRADRGKPFSRGVVHLTDDNLKALVGSAAADCDRVPAVCALARSGHTTAIGVLCADLAPEERTAAFNAALPHAGDLTTLLALQELGATDFDGAVRAMPSNSPMYGHALHARNTLRAEARAAELGERMAALERSQAEAVARAAEATRRLSETALQLAAVTRQLTAVTQQLTAISSPGWFEQRLRGHLVPGAQAQTPG